MDIVERLRHGHARYAAETHQEATIRRIKAMDEAADTIERLREKLKQWEDSHELVEIDVQQKDTE